MSQNRCHIQKLLCERCRIQSKDRVIKIIIRYTFLSPFISYTISNSKNDEWIQLRSYPIFLFLQQMKVVEHTEEKHHLLRTRQSGYFHYEVINFYSWKENSPEKKNRVAVPMRRFIFNSFVFLQRFVTFFVSIVFVLVPFWLGSSRVFLDFFMLMFTLVWLTTSEWSGSE